MRAIRAVLAAGRGRITGIPSTKGPENPVSGSYPLIEETYDQFVEKTAQARHMQPEKVDAVGQGRVWTGRQAKAIGLVDELGGLKEAIAAAKQRAKIPADSDVELVVYPPRRSVYELLSRGFKAEQGSLLTWLLPSQERRALGMALSPLRLFRPNETLALMPALWVD